MARRPSPARQGYPLPSLFIDVYYTFHVLPNATRPSLVPRLIQKYAALAHRLSLVSKVEQVYTNGTLHELREGEANATIF